MDLASLLSNEDFKGLPKEEQRKVMMQNADFSSLPGQEQDKVLSRIPGGFATPPQGETQLRQGRPIREALSSIYTPVLEATGAAAFSAPAIPSAVVAPPVGVPAAILSGAAGYTAGRETARNFDRALGLPVEEPKDIKGVASRTAEDYKAGLGYEVGGRLIGAAVTGVPKAVNRLGQYFAKDTPELIKNTGAIAEEAGFNPTAAERTGSTALSKGEKVLRWFATSGGEFTKRDMTEAQKWVKWRDEIINNTKGTTAPGTESVDRAASAGAKLKAVVDKYVDSSSIGDSVKLDEARNTILKKLGSTESYSDLGSTAQQVMKARNVAASKKATAIYDLAERYLDPKDRVMPTRLMDTATQILKEQEALPPASRNASLVKRLKEFASGGIPEGDVAGMPGYTVKEGKVVKSETQPGYSWDAAKILKGHFREQIESGDTAARKDLPGMKFMSSPEAGTYKRLQGALNEDINTFAKEKGGDFERAIRVGNKFYKKNVMFYNDPDVVKMAMEDPEYLLDMVTKQGATTVPNKFRQAVGPEVFGRFKQKLTNRIFGTENAGVFNPDKTSSMLDKYGETLNQFYTPKEISQMREAVDAGKGVISKGLENNRYFIELLKKDSTRIVGGQHLGEASQPIVGYIVRHDNIPMLSKLESVVGKKEMDNIRATWLSNVIDKNRYGLVQPVQITKILKTFGEDTLNAFLGKETTGNLMRMEKVGVLQKTVDELARNPSGTAQGLMTYFTAMRAGADLASGNLWGVIKELWPPNILAKLYLSPTGIKMLTGTWKLQANTQEAANAYSRLMLIATQGTADAMRGKYPEREQQ